MNVAFVLPNIPRKPGGGAKVVFQYADYLAAKGNMVTIYYMTDRFLKGKLPDAARRTAGRLYAGHCPNWYKLHEKVRHKAAFDENDIEDTHNILIATAVMTAFFVDGLSLECQKYYFIQGFETFYTSEEEVLKSYNLHLKKIVISKWLQDIVYGQTKEIPVHIPNGINLSVFKVTKIIEERSKHSIAFHYREAPLKGCEYAIKTINRLMKKYDDLTVHVIGNVDCPETLKGKCIYHKNISEHEVAEISNNVRVFMCTSVEEGFGLPGLEAMACGCALVTTDYAGAMEYAEHGKNSLISPVRDYEYMSQNVVKLFEDELFLKEISKQAVMTARGFSIEKSRIAFMKYIFNLS